jgi:hypothetical protein
MGAGACLFFLRSGFLNLFFLVPLGFLAFRFNYRIVWTALVITAAGNALFALTAAARSIPPVEILWDILYFTTMASLFTWITAPPPGLSVRVSGGIRLISGSCLGAVLFTVILFRAMASPGFSEYIDSWLSMVISFYQSSGSDVVQNALLESLSPAIVMDLMKSLVLRGGSLISCVLLFFISRQISLGLVRFSLREKGGGSLIPFHAYPALIWIFSVSLPLVIFAKVLKFEIPEIILWNILILCGILYFAQGLGIMQFFLARPAVSPFLRFSLYVLCIVLIFSPVINMILVGGIAILGIAENWVPFRGAKINGPPSTPEAGGDDTSQGY